MLAPKNKDSMSNVMAVALVVCFVCSIMVASAAVLLKPQRVANKNLDRISNILVAAGIQNVSPSQLADKAIFDFVNLPLDRQGEREEYEFSEATVSLTNIDESLFIDVTNV